MSKKTLGTIVIGMTLAMGATAWAAPQSSGAGQNASAPAHCQSSTGGLVQDTKDLPEDGKSVEKAPTSNAAKVETGQKKD
jgi:hypothetical protein